MAHHACPVRAVKGERPLRESYGRTSGVEAYQGQSRVANRVTIQLTELVVSSLMDKARPSPQSGLILDISMSRSLILAPEAPPMVSRQCVTRRKQPYPVISPGTYKVDASAGYGSPRTWTIRIAVYQTNMEKRSGLIHAICGLLCIRLISYRARGSAATIIRDHSFTSIATSGSYLNEPTSSRRARVPSRVHNTVYNLDLSVF